MAADLQQLPPLTELDARKVTMDVLGIHIGCQSYEEMFPLFDRWLADKNSRARAVAVINVHICVTALFDRRLRQMYNLADLTGPDGMPFVRWARLFYKKDSDRFYAPDLLLQVSSKAEEKGYKFFLYGGFPGAADRIEEYLRQRFAGINIVGKYSPPFRALTEQEDQAICEMINKAGADFLWIGLGSPKQDVWIHEHADRLKGCIMMPSGATFDFFSGRIRQAPSWIRSAGLEWFFRLTQDFRRLWFRYTLLNVVFVVAFVLQIVRILRFDDQGNVRILGIRTRLGNA